MKYLSSFFRSFLNLGVTGDQELSRRAYIQYFNFDLLGYLAFAIVTIPIVFLLPIEIRLFLHELCFAYVLLICLCFYLNGMGYYVLSSFIINLGLLAVVAVTDIRIGSESHIHFFIISICMTPLFMLHRRKWLAYSMMAVGIVLFILLSDEIIGLSHPPYDTPEITYFFRRAVNVLIIPVTTLRFLYIFNVNDYYIRQLESQKKYLRKIIDLNPNFIFAKNRKGEFTLVNEAVARTYGTTVTDLLGKTDADFNTDATEVEHFRQDDLEVMDSRKVKAVPIEMISDASGSKRYLQTVKTPIEDEAGTVNQILGVSTDITERMAVQREMQEMQEALRQKNAEMEKYIQSNLQLENFAYIASHDLREPLRSIIGYSQLIEKRYSNLLDADGREYIAHLINATKNMDMLISGLLLFSRINTESIHYRQVHMNDVMAQVRDNLRQAIRDTQANITWQDMPDTIIADRSRIIQLFQNLLGNAIKFHQPGEAPHISVLHRMAGEGHEFTVSDDGIGIEPQYQESIFHIFHRLHNRGEYEGSGIGLATCKKIAEQHNGGIRVVSALGEGSSFIFTIGKITEGAE
jgi:PAS domain S-box-containing protein